MSSDEHIQGLALGKFDGMHLAHKALFEYLPNQSVLLCIQSQNPALTPNKEPYSPFPIISIAFQEIMQWSGEYFMQILKEKFPLLEVLVVGYDFAFGKDRAFNASDLAHLFDKKIIIMPEFCIHGMGVHSSLIREFIHHGDMDNAKDMLGRYYHVQGSIITGQNLGSKALYPTINIQTQGYVLPQDGVYASFTELEGELMPSVSFIGHRLSTDRHFSIETHILNKAIPQIQSIQARIYFIHKIRDNQKFNDLALLKQQISQDIKISQNILAQVDRAYLL